MLTGLSLSYCEFVKMASKGKAVADGKGKRKRDGSDKTGHRKRKNSGAVQFFEDSAFEIDESDSSIDSLFGDGDDDDFLEDEIDTQVKIKSEPGKTGHLPFLPKEEEMTEEEIDKMLEERYKPGSNFVTYAEDRFETKRSIDRNTMTPSYKDPIIWKVKCMVGRERHSAFCLMQKYVDLQSLGTKLHIISAFALEHVKGAIYIEADKQSDVNEACSGLCSIYSTRVAPVPQNEVPHLFNVRSKSNSIAVGTWARVKNGKYKGDLAQVVVVNDLRKKATVKLIPRIDLQAMAAKFGGGVTSKKTATPAPRLICSSELEEFRPLIQIRRDRDTDTYFEILDGMMLKDGYLYKKVPIDSLSFWGILPSEDELLKFEPSKNEESNDVEWLSQLYGEQKKKCTKKSDKGGGKGEGSSSSNVENDFEVHDMVFFSRTGFGIIIGREKDDSFKVLKEGSEGPVVVNVKLRELKKASFDKKFTTWDRHRKTISINDTLRILEGPLEGRQGVVKQIYRGTVFLYDDVEQENGGYCCSKAQKCEKIKLSSDACKEKGGEPGPSGFDDFSSSPKSPLSPKKPWQEKDNNCNFNQGDKDGMFSIGQSLRIRVGPLKGYLCRVLALRRSDVMVKLDSQQKILTVKPEHLAAVCGKNLVVPMGDDSESAKRFDLLGTQDGSRGWMDGAGTSTEAEGWTAGGQSTERSSWAAFPSSSFSLQPESDSADPLYSMDIDSKDVGGSAWETKVASTQNSAWGAAVADEKALVSNEQVGGWGKSDGGWNKDTSDTVFGSSASDSWGRAKVCNNNQPGSSNDAGNWSTAKLKIASTSDSCDDTAPSWGKNSDANNNQDGGWKKSEGAWDKGNNITGDSTSSWGNANVKNQVDSWGKGKDDSSGSKAVWNTSTATPEKETGGWGDTSGGGYNAGGGGRSGGRGGGRGGYGGRGGGSGNACYKCGETGHMARECSQGGGSGGNACYKCGETGHMARECSQGGGDGGNACYKCGEAGHMARECSQGGGGGNACYKCGETGHMARECSQGGGGNACYKCGETGHMARECSQGGSSGGERYGRSSWSASISSNFSLHPESNSSNPLKSKDNDLNKDVGETAWSSKVAPSQNSSWGAANTEQGGGWGKSDGGWKRTSDTGFGSSTSDSWGGAKVSSGDQPGSSKDAVSSWGKNIDATNNQVGGCKKSDESWDKGNITVNPTSSWGNTNAKNQVDSWTKGKDGEDGFNGSKAAWSTSTATPDRETGGWGNVIAGGRSGSRRGGRGGYSGRGSGGGNACYKCGETGHIARECSQGGDGCGGNACYKCGETGHMARECSQGGGGGNACYKCGESGHMARECSQGGGNACYKCGETGHMARECSQGGGTVGNACYKCGETGHLARECSQGGSGRNSRSTWSSSSFLLQPESGSANPLKSTDNVFKKDVEDSAWATKMVPDHNSSWGAAMADDKALGKTEEAGGWGKSVGGWNKTASDTGVCSSTSDCWGIANVTGDGQYGSPKDAGANWGKAKVKSDSPTDTSKDAAPSWGKNTDLNTNQDSGWKKSSEPWDKGSNVTGNHKSSWSSPNGKNQIDSWGNAEDKWANKEGSSGSKAVWNTSRATTEKETGGWGNDTTPMWSKNNDAITNQDGGGWKKSNEAWDKGNNVTGNPTSSWSNPNVKNQEDSWGNAADKWNSKESSCGSKAVWNSSGATTEKEAGGWGNVSGGAGGWGNVSGGGRSDGHSGGQGGYGGRGGGGNACYKCGEAGHIARDCSQGGGRSVGRGGGNGCYKCGEQGHFARECPSSNS